MLLGKIRKTVKPSATLEHERLTSLVNSMADGVIAVDEGGRVVVYNGAALNILNRNDSIERKQLSEIFHPIDKENKSVDVKKLIQDASMPTTNRDLRLAYDEGSVINLYLSIAPVRLGFGAEGLRGYVLLLRDITREKSLEEERDEFISVASHELRTPIAITEGNISNAQFFVEKGGDNVKIKQALEEAHNQILFLAQLVNDLSTLSRAERGKLPLEIETINIHELTATIVDDYEKEAAAKNLQLIADVHVSGPLHSSRLYVREVLQNFLTNALKYTETGSITLSAHTTAGGIIFAVKDTGIGISRSDQKHIFNKFFRSEDYRTRKTSGTGLGLYVTSKLGRLLHAKITFESQLNKGSTFTIFIPDLSSKHVRSEQTQK
jgi:PAS domain S-box-containing protein